MKRETTQDRMPTTLTVERNDSMSVIREGSHHSPPRTRPESGKRKASFTPEDFLLYMREHSQKQIKVEQEMRRQDRDAEMAMRQQELDVDVQLRREEMAQRRKEVEAFTLAFANLAAALLQRK